MHGPMNVKFINTKQAKETYQYRNFKRKLYKSNAAIWYNKTFRGSSISLKNPMLLHSFELLMMGGGSA
jgi:hypothetical protein